MKHDQVNVGGTYIAKVSDKLVTVRIDSVNRHGGWDAINMATNKQVRIKSAQRLRGPAGGGKAATPEAPAAEAPAAKPAKPKKTAAEPKAKKPSGLDAAAAVLKEAGEPMRCSEIVKTMLDKGMWKTNGATPSATIYAAILREIQVKGDESRFKKTDRGLFAFNGK